MIIRESRQETTGTADNFAQSFYQNIFYDASMGTTTPFVFDTPSYTTLGGTKDYYGQNPLAIFTNLVKPFITFDFSANTSSFGPNTYIKHDLYRVSWEVFRAVQSGLYEQESGVIETRDVTTETIEEVDGVTGEVTKKTITRSTNNIQDKKVSNREKFGGESNRSSETFTRPTIANIQDMLDTPEYSFTASTTGISESAYVFQIEQFTKNLGEFKTELFQDRAQYILNTTFIFERAATSGLTDYKVYDERGELSSVTYSSSITTTTDNGIEIIDVGDFQGLQVPGGEFFTYFTVPDKPTIEYPSPSGKIDTFTPEIYWTNGENADQYLVQVTYNTGDTEFTGSVFSYVVPKSDEFKEESVSKTKGPDTEFTSTKAIRKYQLSLKSNQCLLYRVGNVKVIENMFGVKQSVVTFSENQSICTQTQPIKTFVYTENDSPYTTEIAGLGHPPSLDDETPTGDYSLSGVVSGSTVTGATLQLVYQDGSYSTTLTDTVGAFNFTGLTEGVYTLNTTYRGYAADSRSISLTGDTGISIDLKIRWDNSYDIWVVKENDIIKY